MPIPEQSWFNKAAAITAFFFTGTQRFLDLPGLESQAQAAPTRTWLPGCRGLGQGAAGLLREVLGPVCLASESRRGQ